MTTIITITIITITITSTITEIPAGSFDHLSCGKTAKRAPTKSSRVKRIDRPYFVGWEVMVQALVGHNIFYTTIYYTIVYYSLL